MAYDNLMYKQAKSLYEAKGRVSSSTPDMTLINFPPLMNNSVPAQRPALNQPFKESIITAEALKDQLKERRRLKSSPSSETSEKSFQDFAEMIPIIPNQETLWQRIWKVMSLHIA